MTTLGLHSSPRSSYDDLLRVIRRVRNRWRTRRLILGFTIVGAAAVLVVGVSSAAMDALRYAPWVVRGLQVAAWLAFGAAAWRFVVRPLRSRVTDEQVALYVEEHDPTLREAVSSGVELGHRSPPDGAGGGISPDLTRLVVEEAIRRLETLNEGRLIETSALRRAGGALATVGGVAIVASLLAPPALLRGAALLLSPWGDISDANPYRVLVEPGDAAVARDSDRWIAARLEGFTAERVDLLTRAEGSTLWETAPMLPDPEDGVFRHLLLGIPEATDYYVDADGVLSPTFRIEVEDVPYVGRIGLVYRYPEHTGLSPREVEDGGDIAAVAGAVVELTVIPTVPAAAGVLRMEPGPIEIPLEVPEAPEDSRTGAGAEVLTATLRLAESGSYRVALAGPDGNLRTASRDYLVEVLEDLPPIVRFLRPGRDTQANPVEEVFTEVLAEDDYALRRVEMRVSVNGGEETREVLASGGARDEIQSGHTLFLEEHDLVPGDLVSYYAVARDGAGGEAATDIFFIAVRPFDRTYRQGDTMPGAGAGGGGDGLDGTLSLRQKQIVVATFKVLRDRDGMPPSAVTETVATIGLAQGRLREQVATLNRRLRNRGIGATPEFSEIVEHLDAGLVEMTVAEELLVAGDPDDALPREQKALTHLQRADAVFRDVQVTFGQGGGGGGGGGPRAQAEDLASLFELEMDKLRNQYETVEQQRRSTADNEVDELLQRLAELARRQEQENERIRRGVRQSGGGAGSAQDQLAAETDDVARRLERLARERSRPDLAAVSRRLRDAAQDMRSAGNSSEGLESGLSAANELRNARRDLDGQRRERLGRDVQNALDETKRLRAAQDRIRAAVGDLEQERTREAIARVSGQKQDLAERVQRLEQQLDEVSRDWSRDEPEAADAVGEAADGIRDRKLKEKIHYSRGVAAQRSPDYADQFESMIANDLEALEQDLAAAREVVEGSDRAGRDDVLDRAANLVRGLEGLRNRLADRAEQPESQPGSPSPDSAGEESRGGQGGGGAAEGREARQLRRELDRRVEDAEALRRELTGIGASGDRGTDRLGEVVEALRGLTPERLTGDPRGMEVLEAEVLDTLRQLEFELRRALAGGAGADVLTGSDDRAPERYRDMVEEYFRALSRRPT
ncbi:MAG: hypothetical protein F4Z74_04055 [Acidobacteria bacterium]|nr:hypothetical protein [Acidobacteriota bacterium]MXW70611.1 hypothetical protein [Acidobacteriota bacterium]MYE43640.1 hypothetical protein [Acidobacteriota bacterium]